MALGERTIVFIDGSNLYHILKRIFGPDANLADFNFEEFIKEMTRGKHLVRVYYYSAPLDRERDEEKYSKQQKFFDKLRKIPDFELVLCRMQKESVKGHAVYKVKEDDIHIAVDMVKLAYNNAYETAILVSTDGDFVPAINAVKEKGKKVENIGFEKKFSWHLRQKCDRFRQFSKHELSTFFTLDLGKD